MKKKLLSMGLLVGIMVSGYSMAEAASKSVSITASQTSAKTTNSTINADVKYETTITNNKNPFNRAMYGEVKRVVAWGLDDVVSSDKVSSGATGKFTGRKTMHKGSHYLELNPEGPAAAGCVGKGSFTW